MSGVATSKEGVRGMCAVPYLGRADGMHSVLMLRCGPDREPERELARSLSFSTPTDQSDPAGWPMYDDITCTRNVVVRRRMQTSSRVHHPQREQARRQKRDGEMQSSMMQKVHQCSGMSFGRLVHRRAVCCITLVRYRQRDTQPHTLAPE